MSPIVITIVIALYFGVLVSISFFTSKNSENSTFFSADKGSPWYLVSFGMVGASLSGVTFLSVPGKVGASHFAYFQMALGYTAGYVFVAYVLLPIYYKNNVVSIYSYLEQRLGTAAHKTGSLYFLLARSIGAALRLFLVAIVLDFVIFSQWNIPFAVTVAITIALIWIYTFKGGIATVVWTDTLQTLFMLVSLGTTIVFICNSLDWSAGEMVSQVYQSQYSNAFNFETLQGNFFIQFMNGALITMAMTGVDQDMMQKNLTCRSLKDAQKNMMVFSIVLVFVNLAFLSLGALLQLYYENLNIAIDTTPDKLFADFAINQTQGSLFIGIIFILGVVAAAYSSADSALTSLTTSFSVDFLPEKHRTKQNRILTHVGFSILLFIIVLLVKALKSPGDSLIDNLFMAAGFTYGPLLGMFVFSIFSKHQVKPYLVPIVCLLAPILTYFIKINSKTWLGGYQLGHELILVNTLITVAGLYLIKNTSSKSVNKAQTN